MVHAVKISACKPFDKFCLTSQSLKMTTFVSEFELPSTSRDFPKLFKKRLKVVNLLEGRFHAISGIMFSSLQAKCLSSSAYYFAERMLAAGLAS
jgi:hypothetical protein